MYWWVYLILYAVATIIGWIVWYNKFAHDDPHDYRRTIYDKRGMELAQFYTIVWPVGMVLWLYWLGKRTRELFIELTEPTKKV
jgi:hypothetical protein